jgi:hypothetical protein
VIVYKHTGTIKLKLFPGQKKDFISTFNPVVTCLTVIADYLVSGNELGEIYLYKISDTALFVLGEENKIAYPKGKIEAVLGLVGLGDNLSH